MSVHNGTYNSSNIPSQNSNFTSERHSTTTTNTTTSHTFASTNSEPSLTDLHRSSFYETASHSSPSFVNTTTSTSTNQTYTENNNSTTQSSTAEKVQNNDPSTPSTITLNSIKNEEEIRLLPIKQLKLLLTRNFVDYKGCVERDELVNKVLLLYRDKKQNESLKGLFIIFLFYDLHKLLL